MPRSFLPALVVVLATLRPAPGAEDVLIADFEGENYGGWTATGDAFGDRPARGTLPNQQHVSGYRGKGLVNTFRNGDRTTGTLTSPEFEITRSHLAMLVGGGEHPGEVGVELLVGGESVRTLTGADDELLSWRSWNVAEFRGKRARLRIFDRHTGGYGHVNVDHILLTDTPRRGAGTWRLDEYRRSPDYYRERYRPAYHFTPELNWMNDPNGLVFHDGEWHLHYQHNPLGNTWGHMSWGHAVSRDLVHWKHLPISLHEEYGVMAFSGCAVVDHANTSGFGTTENPPLVAVYTGHGHGRQTQDLAYSTDRGRSWTKYRGNPVLDIGEKDFRDPKVFWHAPTKRWVMVVSLAAKKVLQFYGSPDLETWTHLSDFGPAGVKGKPNWECPDLFELPIVGEPGKSRWVLQADMGGNAVAGGSGGEYFVGTFDGTRFTPDEPADRVRWVDHGRDFYAPVSWSNVPESDGRRVWIGWMNNWETATLPTSPWRGAMSIPRELSLVRADDETLTLVQRPVRELRALRGERVHLEGRDLLGTIALAEQGIAGSALEIVAEFEPGTATSFGLRVRVGEGERTIVGCDVAKSEVFVDRTTSGEVGFHPRFAGRHAGPLPTRNGRVRLHLFVDASSVELFAGDGRTVLTERIFPNPASNGVELFAVGGTARLVSLEGWTLSTKRPVVPE